jgi:hypothetical protein
MTGDGLAERHDASPESPSVVPTIPIVMPVATSKSYFDATALHASTVRKMNAPGNKASHGSDVIVVCA